MNIFGTNISIIQTDIQRLWYYNSLITTKVLCWYCIQYLTYINLINYSVGSKIEKHVLLIDGQLIFYVTLYW